MGALEEVRRKRVGEGGEAEVEGLPSRTQLSAFRRRSANRMSAAYLLENLADARPSQQARVYLGEQGVEEREPDKLVLRVVVVKVGKQGREQERPEVLNLAKLDEGGVSLVAARATKASKSVAHLESADDKLDDCAESRLPPPARRVILALLVPVLDPTVSTKRSRQGTSSRRVEVRMRLEEGRQRIGENVAEKREADERGSGKEFVAECCEMRSQPRRARFEWMHWCAPAEDASSATVECPVKRPKDRTILARKSSSSRVAGSEGCARRVDKEYAS